MPKGNFVLRNSTALRSTITSRYRRLTALWHGSELSAPILPCPCQHKPHLRFHTAGCSDVSAQVAPVGSRPPRTSFAQPELRPKQAGLPCPAVEAAGPPPTDP